MTTIRTFIAIELTEQARTALADLQNQIKAIVPSKNVRWTAIDNIHLTLHFLGEIALIDVDKVTAVLEAAAATCRPFSLELTGLGCFPNTRGPRIIWAGVDGHCDTLVKLHRDLGQRLRVIDFRPETRPYSPHLTIGRVKKGIPPRQMTQLSEFLEKAQLEVGYLAPLPVNEINLIKSELLPTGPVYTRLAQSILKKS